MLTLNDLNKKKYITSKKNKKNKITMYDMGFGDAHILECDEFNSKEKLLVDCGSKNPKKCNVDKSLDLISKSLQGCHVSFLLTHFHNDHYNQLKKLKKLKNVYFDRIFVANIYSHIPTVYMTIYELLIYKKNSYYWNLAFDLLKEIPNLFSMLKENGILCFVSENSNFNLNNDVYKILSPKKGMKNLSHTNLIIIKFLISLKVVFKEF